MKTERGLQAPPPELNSLSHTASTVERDSFPLVKKHRRWNINNLHISRLSVASVLAGVFLLMASHTAANADSLSDGSGPAFSQEQVEKANYTGPGFKAIAMSILDATGQALGPETPLPNGDVMQQTEKGAMFWRKADNWTAFTNGARTWVNGPLGLQERGNDERFEWEKSDRPAASTNVELVSPLDYQPEIVGTPEYIQKINAALKFFKENDPELYSTLIKPDHVQLIKQIPLGGFALVWGEARNGKITDPRPMIQIGDDVAEATPILSAGVIAHEATHSKQKHEQIATQPTPNMPRYDERAGEVQPYKAAKRVAQKAAERGFSPRVAGQVIAHYDSLIITNGGDPNTELDFSASIIASGK